MSFFEFFEAWLAPWLAMTSPALAEGTTSPTTTPSIEDMLMDLINKATGGAVDTTDGSSTPSLLFLGLGSFDRYTFWGHRFRFISFHIWTN